MEVSTYSKSGARVSRIASIIPVGAYLPGL